MWSITLLSDVFALSVYPWHYTQSVQTCAYRLKARDARASRYSGSGIDPGPWTVYKEVVVSQRDGGRERDSPVFRTTAPTSTLWPAESRHVRYEPYFQLLPSASASAETVSTVFSKDACDVHLNKAQTHAYRQTVTGQTQAPWAQVGSLVLVLLLQCSVVYQPRSNVRPHSLPTPTLAGVHWHGMRHSTSPSRSSGTADF